MLANPPKKYTKKLAKTLQNTRTNKSILINTYLSTAHTCTTVIHIIAWSSSDYLNILPDRSWMFLLNPWLSSWESTRIKAKSMTFTKHWKVSGAGIKADAVASVADIHATVVDVSDSENQLSSGDAYETRTTVYDLHRSIIQLWTQPVILQLNVTANKPNQLTAAAATTTNDKMNLMKGHIASSFSSEHSISPVILQLIQREQVVKQLWWKPITSQRVRLQNFPFHDGISASI